MSLPEVISLSDIISPLVLIVMTFYFKEIREMRINIETIKVSLKANKSEISRVETDSKESNVILHSKISKLDTNVSSLNAFKAAQKEINNHRNPKQTRNHCL